VGVSALLIGEHPKIILERLQISAELGISADFL